MAFDRLIQTVDSWIDKNRSVEVFAQIAEANYLPQNMTWRKFLTSFEFTNVLKKSELVVSHAGMGTIICALQNNLPVLVMPRKAILKETRNDHQMHTVKALKKANYIHAAWNEKQLIERLNQRDQLKPLMKTGVNASAELLEIVDNFIRQGR